MIPFTIKICFSYVTPQKGDKKKGKKYTVMFPWREKAITLVGTGL